MNLKAAPPLHQPRCRRPSLAGADVGWLSSSQRVSGVSLTGDRRDESLPRRHSADPKIMATSAGDKDVEADSEEDIASKDESV